MRLEVSSQGLDERVDALTPPPTPKPTYNLTRFSLSGYRFFTTVAESSPNQEPPPLPLHPEAMQRRPSPEDADELGRHQVRTEGLHFGHVAQKAQHVAVQLLLVGKLLRENSQPVTTESQQPGRPQNYRITAIFLGLRATTEPKLLAAK